MKSAADVIAEELKSGQNDYVVGADLERWAMDILAALDSAGYCIVPMEPTRSQIDAAFQYGKRAHATLEGRYRAMIDARPKGD